MGYVGRAFFSGFAGAAGVMVAVTIFLLVFGNLAAVIVHATRYGAP